LGDATQSVKMIVHLRKRSQNRILPALKVAAAQHNGWLVDLAQWFPKYWSKPKQRWRRVKKWVAQKQAKLEPSIFNVTSASLCPSVKARWLTLKMNLATCYQTSSIKLLFFHTFFDVWFATS